MNPQFMSTLSQALLVGISDNPQPFEQQSEVWERDEGVMYITHLSEYLVNEQNVEGTRVLAGLTLKNFFPSDDRTNNGFKSHRWMSVIPEDAKVVVRQNAYNALKTQSNSVRRTAAQIIGKIAEMDFPHAWGSLMQLLMDLAVNDENAVHHKLGALRAIGYACEELDPDQSPGVSDLVLTAVIHNMQSSELQLKNDAVVALRSSLHFCRKNFQTLQERDILINTILKTITCGNIEIAVEAFGVLVDIVHFYYFEIESHIESIFGVTLSAIQEADEEIAKMAIEFWNSVCEEEMHFREEQIEHKNYTKSALEMLVPTLFQAITKQEEDYDPDDQNLPIASCVCLTYLGKTVHEAIVPHLVPLVEKHINSSNWNEQDAAILSLGAILYAPTEKIANLIVEAVPILLTVLETSPYDTVRDTALWTVGQIFHLHPHVVLSKANEIIILMGSKTVNEVPRVSTQACWVIHAITEVYGTDPVNPVYAFFGDLIDCLLKTAERTDAGEYLLRINAYETLIGLLPYATEANFVVISQLYDLVCNELDASINLQSSDPFALAEKQEMLCAMITVLAPNLFDKIHATHVPLMNVLCNLLNSSNGQAISAEVFLTITLVAQILDTEFIPHIPATMNLVLQGIRDVRYHKTCQYATDLLSDMIGILGIGFIDYAETIMEALFENLRNPEVNRSVKPYIYEAFGEVALSLGDYFQKYLPSILNVLIETINDLIMVDEESLDEETLEYLDTLRKGVFSAFTGVLTEVRNNNDIHEQIHHVAPNLMILIERTAVYNASSLDTISAAIGLIGDLAQKIAKKQLVNIITPTIVDFVQYYTKSNVETVKEESIRVDSIFRRNGLY